MEILKKMFKGKPKNLWKLTVVGIHQLHATSVDTTTKPEEINDEVIYMEDLEKRKESYGICGECYKPGTGMYWCQSCNAKRFKENFKNWTSGNKNIDELIQYSQLNATYFADCLEWIPFEKFQNVTFINKGGFGKIYSAEWPEGYIKNWDIENQEWERWTNSKVALKSLDNSSDISADFLNEVKSHYQLNCWNITLCFGVTQDPNTKDYMMVLLYYKGGSLRNYLNQSENYMFCQAKIHHLSQIAKGLLAIHNAEKVHKDLHPGNILFGIFDYSYISDLGMCRPANNKAKKGVYGVLPYVAPEVLCGYEYTKASDIYSFGIVMNEFLSEEIPYNDLSHDYILAANICKGLRPKIFEYTPKLLADLIKKCLDVKAENRPTTKELYQILNKLEDDKWKEESEIYPQIKEYDKIKGKKVKNSSIENKSDNIQTHTQAIYTSRLLNFKNLPKLSSDLSDFSSFQTSSASANQVSECLDCQLSELDLNDEINQDGENNFE